MKEKGYFQHMDIINEADKEIQRQIRDDLHNKVITPEAFKSQLSAQDEAYKDIASQYTKEYLDNTNLFRKFLNILLNK